MMYTFGDSRQTLPASAKLMEEIVRQNIVWLLIQASQVCHRRGSRFMNVEDVLFAIRHDTVNVRRVLEFLSWKDIRKEAKNAGNREQKDTLDVDELVGGDLDETLDDETMAKTGLPRRRRPRLSFDFYSSFYEYLDDEDRNLDEDFSETILRLKEADELTKKMTMDEYMDYSDCRQASFTFKKNKKFRDWLNIQKYIDMKPNDDVIEILGYIAWETVAKITKAALIVKKEMESADMLRKRSKREEMRKERDLAEKNKIAGGYHASGEKSSNLPPTALSIGETQLPENIDEIIEWLSTNRDLERVRDCLHRTTRALITKREMYFPEESDDIEEEPCPIMPIHIYEACRRLQNPSFPLKLFEGGAIRIQTNLVSLIFFFINT
jgi:hypothetical protein